MIGRLQEYEIIGLVLDAHIYPPSGHRLGDRTFITLEVPDPQAVVLVNAFTNWKTWSQKDPRAQLRDLKPAQHC